MTDERHDAATLSAAATAIEELTERIVAIADRYRRTPSEDVAISLYEVERDLKGAKRRLDRLIHDRLR